MNRESATAASRAAAIHRNAVRLGRKQYAAALVVMNRENPVTLSGGPPSCGISKTLAAGSLAPTRASFDAGLSRTRPANDPSSTHSFNTNSYWFSM